MIIIIICESVFPFYKRKIRMVLVKQIRINFKNAYFFLKFFYKWILKMGAAQHEPINYVLVLFLLIINEVLM